MPYEDRAVIDAELFRTFPERAAPLWANWGFEPLCRSVWQDGQNIGEVFAAMRRECERAWGCENLELPVSRLSRTEAFARFAGHILATCRGSATSTTPPSAPTATPTASAARTTRPRTSRRAKPRSGCARRQWPRAQTRPPHSDVRHSAPGALTLTLFARVCLGDFFIHGIGGGKYDEVTDAIIRDYFGIEPARVPGALRDAPPAAAGRFPRPPKI